MHSGFLYIISATEGGTCAPARAMTAAWEDRAFQLLKEVRNIYKIATDVQRPFYKDDFLSLKWKTKISSLKVHIDADCNFLRINIIQN